MKIKGTAGIALTFLLAGLSGAEILPVTQEGVAQLARQIIPLPHEFSVGKEAILKPTDISLKLRADAGDVEKTGFAELENLFREKTGEVPAGNKFLILVGVLDGGGALEGRKVANTERLHNLPNSNQAYVIHPDGENAILVTGLNEKGVYYGVQTLKQLLAPGMSGERVSIPLAEVTDWPDFDERGVWNVAPDISWMSALKLNYRRISAISRTFRRNEKVSSNLTSQSLEAMRNRAFVLSVSTTHLNFLNRPDYGKLYEAYPEIAGKGDSAFQKMNPSPYHQAPCASEPILVDVLEGMMLDMAEKGAQEADVWQTEFVSGCACERCIASGKGQIGLETDAIVAAWRKVQKQYPAFNLRIFFSLADKTPETSAALKTLPAEVKINYVYGDQEPFEKAAINGRWVSYWMVPVYLKFALKPTLDRLHGLYKNRWAAAYGYAGMAFSHAALAEWTWNLNGRSQRDFAISWAIRQGCEKPEVFADWVERIGILNEDMYPSWVHSRLGLRAMTKKIESGGSSFGHVDNRDRKLVMAREAVVLADELQKEELITESRQALAFFRLLDAAARLAETVSVEKPLTQKKTEVEDAMKNLEKAVAGMKEVDGKTEFNETWLGRVQETLKKQFGEI